MQQGQGDIFLILAQVKVMSRTHHSLTGESPKITFTVPLI